MISLTKTLSLLLFASLCISLRAHDHQTCDHDTIEQDPEFLDIVEDTSSFQGGKERVLASYSNIRIQAYYDFVDQTASSALASYVRNELIPPIISYLQSALRVKSPVVGPLKLTSSKICERTTPSILKSGVDADFFIYYDTTAQSGSQIANTMYCSLASGTKRPLVGRTMINRNNLQPANGDLLAHERNMYVLMHEAVHALGFSNYLFPHFIDENGKTRTGHIKTTQLAGSTRTVIDVPPLTDKLRNFYGCSTLPGAILENNGGDATASSHFEKKYFLYEFMCSGSISGRRVSEFSLSLLEGSGWYVPDYSYAEPFFYGQGQGCDFLNYKCSSSTPGFDEYCVGSTRGCTPHGRGGGSCNSDSIMDGCKFIFPFDSNDCENDNGADNTRLADLQVFGRNAGSKCFTGDLNTRKSTNGRTSFCFKYTCSGSDSSTQLNVQVGNHQITCTQEGQKVIDGYYGSIDCPDPLTFCNTIGKKYCPRNCMGRGSCVDGVCQCNSGFNGIDCALNN